MQCQMSEALSITVDESQACKKISYKWTASENCGEKNEREADEKQDDSRCLWWKAAIVQKNTQDSDADLQQNTEHSKVLARLRKRL